MWVTDNYINSALAGPKPGWRRVGQEAENYDIDILEIGEAWWRRTGKGKLILGHIILYLGREDDWHTKAVAMIISRKVEKHSLNASKHDQDCIMLATTQSTPNWKRGIEKEDPLLMNTVTWTTEKEKTTQAETRDRGTRCKNNEWQWGRIGWLLWRDQT